MKHASSPTEALDDKTAARPPRVTRSTRLTPVLRVLVHIVSLAPLALLLWDASRNNLTVNPIQEITARTGTYALLWLIFTLACTPINTLFGFKPVMALRRPLGLYAFFYTSLHLLTFVGLDFGFDLGLITQEIVEKRYVLAGFAAFVLLVPLAFTSTRWWIRRLGSHWRSLHRLVYAAALLGVVHYLWLVKTDIREPLLYGAVVAGLLTLRVPAVRRWVSRWRAGRLKR